MLIEGTLIQTRLPLRTWLCHTNLMMPVHTLDDDANMHSMQGYACVIYTFHIVLNVCSEPDSMLSQQGVPNAGCRSTRQTYARAHTVMAGLPHHQGFTTTTSNHHMAGNMHVTALVHIPMWSCMCKAAAFGWLQYGNVMQRCDSERQLYLFNNVKENLVFFIP